GRVMPHLELAHHPLRGKKTYEDYIGREALEKVGKKKWNKRVARVIDVLRRVVNFDHLYLGGGNAKKIELELPADVTIVPNSDGLTGRIALWRDQEAAPAGRAPLAKPKPQLARRPPRGRPFTAAQPRTA